MEVSSSSVESRSSAIRKTGGILYPLLRSPDGAISFMRLTRVQIENFRCFEKLTLDLDPHFTLIAGGNGSGKTTVIRSLVWALSSVAWRIGAEHSAPDQADVRLVRQQVGDQVRFEPRFPTLVSSDAELGGKHSAWEVGGNAFNALSILRSSSDGWETALTRLDSPGQGENRTTFPLLVCYPAGRAWNRNTSPIQWNNILKAKPSRNDGYSAWQNASSNLVRLTTWLVREQLISLQRKRETVALKTVKRVLIAALEGAVDVEHNVEEGEVTVTFTNGEAHRLGELSDGQRNMLAMFGDLAIRAVQINGFLGEDAPVQTPGVVLIDELDLHLHPRWQRKIVHLLKETFPQVQFIATSHSPQIIGELPPEQIIILENGVPSHPAESFGRDTNFILREVMDAEPRNTDVAEALEQIRTLIDDEHYDDALQRIDEWREKIGADPELERAEALVKRITLIGT